MPYRLLQSRQDSVKNLLFNVKILLLEEKMMSHYKSVTDQVRRTSLSPVRYSRFVQKCKILKFLCLKLISSSKLGNTAIGLPQLRLIKQGSSPL
jgi:hypothetical protein